MYKNIIKNHIVMYFLIIICSFVFVAGGTLLENKSKPKNIIVEQNKICAYKVFAIKFDNIEELKIFADFNYKNYLKCYTFLNKFYNNTKNKFEYDKFCSNWDNLNKEQKLKWLQSHIKVNNFNMCVYECIFFLNKKDNKDYNYSKQNAPKFIEELILNIKQDVSNLNKNATFVDMDSLYLDDARTINKEKIYRFNIINSCFLGLLLGLIICFVDILRRSKVVK